MKEQLKIAIYSGDIPSTTFIERLIIGLSRKDCKIYLFGFIKKKVSYSQSISVFAYNNTKIGKTLFLIKYSLLLFLFKSKDKRKLDAILKKQSKNLLLDKVKCYPVLWHRPDVFHVQWAKGLADWVWVKAFGIKLVLSLRGAHINYSPIADTTLAAMYKDNFPKVDAFHAVSKAMGLEAEKYNASREKIHIVYSGLPLSEFETHIDAKIESLLLRDHSELPFQIISVGRPHWKKGYTYALDALKDLKDQGLRFHYTIVGAANHIEFIYQVYDLKLENEVTLLDTLPYFKVQELMAEADLLLLPSIEEGIANVVLEAMKNRTLVLTTDCGGMQEVIRDGYNGFVVPIRDSDAIAKKIIDIMKIEEIKKRILLNNAVDTIKFQHSEKQMVNEMLALYQTI